MENKWTYRFSTIRFLGWLAMGGVICLLFAAAASRALGYLSTILAIFGLLLFLPAFIYLYVIIILHWKDRYRGRHSDLWGVIILVETTGWMKIVYFLRHMLPDMNHSGRYRLEQTPNQDLPGALPPND